MRAHHYQGTVNDLESDPLIIEMAIRLPQGIDLAALSSWEYVSRASAEYAKRGGKVPTHIGGPAEAISNLLRRERERT